MKKIMKNFESFLPWFLLLTHLSFRIALKFDASFHPIKTIEVKGVVVENFGVSVANAGDINKDGYDDILIGAEFRNARQGAVYVIYGGPTTSLSDIDFATTILDPLTTGFMITGNKAAESTGDVFGDYFGSSVSSAGDINKDGYDDIIVGAPAKNFFQGAAYVIYGGPKSSMSNIALSTTALNPLTTGFMISGIGSSGHLGDSVSSAGDINGDGYADVIIVAKDRETAYVIYGGEKSTMTNIDLSTQILNPLTTGFVISGGYFSFVKGLGDINKDGYADFILAVNSQSQAYVFYGRPKSSLSNIDLLTQTLDPLTTGFQITGAAPFDYFGQSMSAGDINKDGYNDIIIGAHLAGSWKGAAYVIYGGPKSSSSHIDLSATPLDPQTTGFSITGGVFGDQIGWSVSSAEDVNKDGYVDVVVGSYRTSSNKGAVYVVYGGPKASRSNIDFSSVTLDPATTGFKITGDAANDEFGKAVCSGDFNKDGISDIFVATTVSSRAWLILNGCPSNCKACYSSSACQECSPGYGMKNSLCEKCPVNCDSCSVSTSCDTCSGSYLAHSGQCVTNCPQKMFASSGKCQGCPVGCSGCTSLSACQGCLDGYKLSGLQLCTLITPIICPAQTFLSNGECLGCPAGCSMCTSLSTCQGCFDGFTLTESHICKEKTEIIEVEEIDDIEEKGIEKTAAGAFEGTLLVTAALGSGSSLPLNFGLATKFLRNIKYMKLSVSRELQETFISWKMPSRFLRAPDSWSLEYSSKGLPGVFSRYGLQSAFLINFWKPLVLALIGIAVFGGFKLIEVSIKNKKDLIYTIVKQVNIAASSFALIEFYGNLDDVILYFVLEIRSTKFESGFRIGSSVIAIVLLLIGGLFIVLHSKFMKRYQKAKEPNSSIQLAGFISRFANLSLIFIDFKDKNSFVQSFLMINVIRSIMSSLIFATLFEYPLVQISFLLALNILMIGYLCWKRSFKKLSNTLSQIFCEIALLVAQICVFLLALSDHNGSDPVLSVDTLSKCIIIINFILLFGCAVLLIVNMGRILYQSYLERRKAQRVLPKENDMSASDQRLSTNSGLINRSQSILQSDRNPLKTLPDDNQQEISKTSFVQNRTKNRNPTGGFDISSANVEDLEEANKSSKPSRSRHRELALARIAQGSKMKDSLRNKSPESQIQDPSLHSRMIVHQNSRTANQDVSMTNLE